MDVFSKQNNKTKRHNDKQDSVHHVYASAEPVLEFSGVKKLAKTFQWHRHNGMNSTARSIDQGGLSKEADLKSVRRKLPAMPPHHHGR
jgi:hypothetical protein